MPEGPAIFPLWDGKNIVGYHASDCYGPFGKCLVVNVYSPLKEPYGVKAERISVPIHSLFKQISRTIHQYQLVLDIRKKSQRQINILNNCKGD